MNSTDEPDFSWNSIFLFFLILAVIFLIIALVVDADWPWVIFGILTALFAITSAIASYDVYTDLRDKANGNQIDEEKYNQAKIAGAPGVFLYWIFG